MTDSAHDIVSFGQKLSRMAKQAQFASVVAATRTAKSARDHVRTHMDIVFDRPVAYVKRGVMFRPAKKNGKTAQVFIADWRGFKSGNSVAEMMLPHIFGGTRMWRRGEAAFHRRGLLPSGRYLVPQKAALTARGNISPSKMQKVLAALRAYNDPQQWSREGKGYFYARGNDHLRRGIYERRKSGGLRALFIETGPPQYQLRFDFFGEVERHVKRSYPDHFSDALAEAMVKAVR